MAAATSESMAPDPATAPTTKRSDVGAGAEDDAQKLANAAAELERNGALDDAIETYAKALEARIGAYHDRHIEVAPFYVSYSRALLLKAQSDPFGSKVSDKDKEQPAEESGASSSAQHAEEGSDDEGEGEDDGEEGAEEADDLELAFQCLEMARLIHEQESPRSLKMAEVLELIGEVQMENEVWEGAIAELEKARDIYEAILPPDDRQLAHIFYLLATATAALVESKRAEAKAHYDRAAEVLAARLGGVEASKTEEQKELRELLAEVQSRSEDFAPLANLKQQQQQQQQQQAAQPAQAAPPSSMESTRAGVLGSATTGASASTSMFGAIDDGACTGTTTIGFGGGPTAAIDLGVMGGVRKKKKAVLEPISANETEGKAAAAKGACKEEMRETATAETNGAKRVRFD